MPHPSPAPFDGAVLAHATADAVRKLHPRVQVRNPVMFVTYVGAAMTTALALRDQAAGHGATFPVAVSAGLWFTVLFANFAEALAEGRGRAQAAALRAMRTETRARRLAGGVEEVVAVPALRRGDIVVCAAGDPIPLDGEVIEGVAFVDESAVTGESAPVLREAGGDRSAVTGGTHVLTDRLVIRVTAEPGHGFVDRMISLVEGAERRKTPNELALHVLLVGLTLAFLLAVATLVPVARYAGVDVPVSVATALLVCLIPTTIGGLVSAVGIAGMDRLLRANVLASSGRAVEAAGDVDTLLLDKTGTITLGNRQATELLPAAGVATTELTAVAQLASLADETAEGRSILALARRLGSAAPPSDPERVTFVPFTAATRLSGCDWEGRPLRKGAADSIRRHVEALGGVFPVDVEATVGRVADLGATPLVVSDGARILGVVRLADVVKPGIRERFARFRATGIRTVMITGDNPRTAHAIAEEAGIDEYVAEATPELKLARIREEQARGHVVAMTGDGTNDAPALAQADVGVAMGTGTQAAREAGNMVDLDSDPTKLLDVVQVGKELLLTRGALTTFSVANDVSKYFAILPALFVSRFPGLGALNVMHLATPRTAILAAVLFNALVIVALVPLALRGVSWRPLPAAALLRRNLLLYGLGGLVAPFAGIKAIDLVLTTLGMP